MCKWDDASFDNEDVSITSDKEHLWSIDLFSVICRDDITKSDAAMWYFVSGYIARSVARHRRCSCCKDVPIEYNKIPVIAIPEQYKNYSILLIAVVCLHLRKFALVLLILECSATQKLH